jgi:hypothetical protein
VRRRLPPSQCQARAKLCPSRYVLHSHTRPPARG